MVDALAVVSMVNSQLPAESSSRLEEIACEIESIREQSVFLVGERLAEAQDIYRYNRAERGFRGWVEARLNMSLRVAYRHISACRAFGKECVPLVAHIPAQLVYDLSTDEAAPVRQELIARLSAGERVEPAEVKVRLREAREALKISRLTPKHRRTLKSQERRRERERQEWEAEQAARTDARREAARMIVDALDGDLPKLIALLKVCGSVGASDIEAASSPACRPRSPAMMGTA